MSAVYSITITNSQSVATPAPFQQMLVLNLSSLVTSASQLLNLQFCSDSSCTSQLYAWIESYNSNFSEVVVWVNLPNGIPAGSSVTIYVTLSNTNQYPYTGMAPQLTSTYGQYDNGDNVFIFYDNFAGTSLNTNKWVNNTSNTGGSIEVNNGLTITPGSQCTPVNNLYSKNTYGAGVLEMYGTISSSSPGSSCAQAFFGFTDLQQHLQNVAYVGWMNNVWGLLTASPTTPSVSISGLSPGTYIWQIFVPSNTPSAVYASQNYGTQIESTSSLPQLPLYIGFVLQPDFGANITATWVRLRAYPPDGVMPSISSPIAYTPPSTSTEAFYTQQAITSAPSPTPTSTEAFYTQAVSLQQVTPSPTSTEAFYVQPVTISIITSTEAFYVQPISITIPTSTEAFFVQRTTIPVPTSTEAFYIHPTQITVVHVTIPEFLGFLSIPQGIYSTVSFSPSININFEEAQNYIISLGMNVSITSSNVTPVTVTQKTPFEFQLISGFLASSLFYFLMRNRRKKSGGKK